MTSATQQTFAKDSWQTPRNARTLRAYMALRNQEIGARLRDLRGSRPQTLIANELGVAERTYQNWEAGDAKPSWRNLQKVASYYRVTEEFILTGADGGRELPADVASNDKVEDVAVEFRERVNATHSQLDRIEGRLGEARSEQDRISGLIDKQTEALEEQAGVLRELRDAVTELRETISMQQASARHLEEMTRAATQALPSRPRARARKSAPTGTSPNS
jgi:transcriptional regulator with XRE-family HTH domain